MELTPRASPGPPVTLVLHEPRCVEGSTIGSLGWGQGSPPPWNLGPPGSLAAQQHQPVPRLVPIPGDRLVSSKKNPVGGWGAPISGAKKGAGTPPGNVALPAQVCPTLRLR